MLKLMGIKENIDKFMLKNCVYQFYLHFVLQVDLKYQVDRSLAALMTSDWGTSGGAEMQLDNPVSLFFNPLNTGNPILFQTVKTQMKCHIIIISPVYTVEVKDLQTKEYNIL